MSGNPSLPAIRNEDLRDPEQFRVKYEMEPFQFNITQKDLKFGGAAGLCIAAVELATDATLNGIDKSMLAFPVHEAGNVINPFIVSIEDSLANAPLSSRSFGTEHPRAIRQQAVMSALPKQPSHPVAPLEYRAGVAAGVTASLAFATVALLSGIRYGQLFRKKHFKSKKSDVEAARAAYANSDLSDSRRPGP